MSILLLTGLNAAFAASAYQSVEDMVTDQKTIRVVIDDAPGFGNQAATINLMNRLWAMQFTGTFELVYPDYDRDREGDVSDAKQKVLSLFNLPENIPPVYEYEDKQHHKITFISDKEYMQRLLNNTVAPVKIGVTGAHDSPNDWWCMMNHQCITKVPTFDKYTQSNVFVYMQPWFLWPQGDAVLVSGNKNYLSPPGRYLVYPVVSFADAKEYLQTDERGKKLAQEKPALMTLMSGIEASSFNFLPVYGYTILNDNHPEENYAPYPNIMMQIITGARYAEMNDAINSSKPLIIGVFYDFDAEVKEMASLMTRDDWGAYEKQGGANMRAAIKALGLNKPGVVVTASLTEADAKQKIQSLQPGQIMLLSVGPLPKIVFDGIFTHRSTNIWSPVREGEGSLNALINKGRPQFRCSFYVATDEDGEDRSKWEPGFDLITDTELLAKLKEFYSMYGFCDSELWLAKPEYYKTIGELIIAANKPNTSLSNYFEMLFQDSRKPEKDRIYRALQETLKSLHD